MAVGRAVSRGSGARLLYRLVHLGPLEPWLRRFALVACLGLRLRVVGARRLPRRGPLVVTGTHVNRQDFALFAVATGRHMEFVGGAQFLRIPVCGFILRWGGWYPLREAGLGVSEENATSVADAVAAARAGAAVGIFAQGFTARVATGSARIAAAAAAPVGFLFTYRVYLPPATPRALVVVHRPLAPPAPDVRSCRLFRDRLARRMRALGALRPDEDLARVLDAALDDPRVWRDPPRVVRLSARLARRSDASLARRARHLCRACGRLRCSVGDLRQPCGAGAVAAFVALLPLAALGVLLFAPPFAALALRLRGFPILDVRTAVLRVAASVLVPWSLVLAAAGLLAAGAPGLLLPPVAVAGAVASGVARQLLRRLRGSVAARRHGHRLRARLAEFDRLVADVCPWRRCGGEARSPRGSVLRGAR